MNYATFLTSFLNKSISISMAKKPSPESRGIVTKPNHSINFVVQEMPAMQGAAASGKML